MSSSNFSLRARAAWTASGMAVGVVAVSLLAACQASTPQPAAPAPSSPTPAKKKERPAPGATPPSVATVSASAPFVPPFPPPTDLFKITADRAAFYAFGPQQPGGPSLSLKKGDRVTLLKRGFGFSQVKLTDQQVGFVGTEEMAKVTPEEFAAEQARLAPPPAPLAGRSFFRPGGVPRPQLPPSIDADLPRADGPAPKPEPAAEPTSKFRY